MTNREIVGELIKVVNDLGGSYRGREDWNLREPCYRAHAYIRITRIDTMSDEIHLRPDESVEANDEAIGVIVRWLLERTSEVRIGLNPGSAGGYRAMCTDRNLVWGHVGIHHRPDMALVITLTSWLRENADRIRQENGMPARSTQAVTA